MAPKTNKNKNGIRKIPMGVQRNKLRFTLDDSELKAFSEHITKLEGNPDLKDYLQLRLTKVSHGRKKVVAAPIKKVAD